jgi:hypothetical protein
MSDANPLADESARAIPPLVEWFAPWRWLRHWRPWKRWALVVVIVLAGYVVSPVLWVPFVHRFSPPPPVLQALNILYAPLEAAYGFCPPVKWTYDTAFAFGDAVIESLIGPAPGLLNAPLPTPPPPPLPPPG